MRCAKAVVVALMIAPSARAQTAEEITAIAEEAYVFAYPMLEHYKTMHASAIDPKSPRYRAPFNRLVHFRRLLDHNFTNVVSPNNDTLYSPAWLDLRAEPMVLTVPAVKDQRYYVFQFVDLYTHNFAYVGSRTTGSSAGSFLIAGPKWRGKKPKEIKQVLRSEGQLVFLLGRTSVVGAKDLPAVHALQDQYKLTTLSEFLGNEAPAPVERLRFPKYDAKRAASVDFIEYVNFLLAQSQLHPSEKALTAKLAKIGIGAGKPFNPDKLPAPRRRAIEKGIAQAQKKIAAHVQARAQPKNGWLMSMDGFGDRKKMQGRYLTRAASARIALYGNSAEEAIYPSAFVDANGRTLNGKNNKYVLRFTKGQLPPVDAFWSVTMYRLPERLFVPNEDKRYAIGDRTKGLKYEKDGSLTIYLQHESPGKDKESNWLPAPRGEFYLLLRLFAPKPNVLKGKYVPPPVTRAK